MSTYHTDQPLESSDEDLFGRAQYAENIAKVILTQPIDEKYIIGLYSPWGYGKSSMLNMMQSHLEQEDTLVILFNPWIYTDLHSMTAGLLSEVATKINDVELGYDRVHPTGLKEKSKRWAKRSLKMTKTRGVKNTIADSIGSVAEATSYSTQGVSIGKSVANAARMVGKESFNTLKKNVEQNIKDLNKRVVVIVDDVDRLDKDEIFQLFKLVKAVADFKGITYVIAFDDVAVAQALNSRFSSDNSAKAGRDFLEKIIQIPLSLPHIPREELRDMFIKDINSLLAEYKLEVSDEDQDRFWTIFDKHILPHLKTPRMIKRYLNLLTFTLPLAGNEMNVTDVIALAGLKLIYPSTYTKVQGEKLLLTGNDFEFLGDDEARREKHKKKFEALVDDNDEDAGSILSELFPVIGRTYSSSSNTWYDSSDNLKANKRVASLDYFDRYFVFGISNSDVSDENVKKALSLGTPEAISDVLKKMAKDPNAQKLIITKVKLYKGAIEDASLVLKGLMNASDYLSSAQSSGFFTRNGIDVFSDLLFDILKTQSKDKLGDALTLLSLCPNTELLTYIIRDVDLDMEDKKDKPALKPEEFESFKKAAVEKIAKFAKTNKFYESPNEASYILYQYWYDYAGEKAVSNHLQKIIKTNSDILDFLTSYLPTWSGSNGKRRGDFSQAAYDTVRKLINPDILYKKLIKNDAELANINEFVRLEHRFDDSDVNKVGNETSDEFRKILAQQFAYIHQQTKRANEKDNK